MIEICCYVTNSVIKFYEGILERTLIEYSYSDKDDPQSVFSDFSEILFDMLNKEVRFRVYSNNIDTIHKLVGSKCIRENTIIEYVPSLRIDEAGEGYFVDYDTIDTLAEVIYGEVC